ncbi:MAG: hypothetical protein KBT04_06735 [Bacteroidales bacterium]|nr:hypothetical protein [Candidatus Colimorpha onthohippi]
MPGGASASTTAPPAEHIPRRVAAGSSAAIAADSMTGRVPARREATAVPTAEGAGLATGRAPALHRPEAPPTRRAAMALPQRVATSSLRGRAPASPSQPTDTWPPATTWWRTPPSCACAA